ncbi:MAG: LamG-like jellyroll fold domain-containing protein [Pirellulaceae bacterium]
MLKYASLVTTLVYFAFMASASAELVVHLGFDEGTGSIVTNNGRSGGLNNGVLGSTTVFAPGKLGSGLMFDNTSASVVEAGPTPVVGSQARTASVWVNTSGGTGLDSLFTFGITANGQKFDIDVDNDNGGHIELGVGGGRTDFSGVTPAVNDGGWHMVTVVVPDVAGPTLENVDFYVDGTFAYNGSLSGATREVVTSPEGSLALGRCANNAACQPLQGTLDDVAIWNTALSAAEISILYQVGNSAAAIDAGGFQELLDVHVAGAGFAIVNNTRWDFATGLTGPLGLNGSGANLNIVLDDVANTGLSTTGVTFPEGDVNLDGAVTTADFDIIAGNFHNSVTGRSDGDLNSDGVVDFTDFRIWKSAAGNIGAAVQSVPEPATMLLLVAGAVVATGRFRRLHGASCLVLVSLMMTGTADRCQAQFPVIFQPAGDEGNWSVGTNWDGNLVPDGLFDEYAVLNSKLAIVDSVIAAGPGEVQIGNTGGAVGRLEIRNGGALDVVVGTPGITDGILRAGLNGGVGMVTILDGGTLSAETINIQGNITNPVVGITPSTLSLSGTGSINSRADTTLNSVTQISGKSVTFNVGGNLNLGGASELKHQVEDGTPSVISVAGIANLGGVLNVDFGGTSPTGGSSWTLFDAAEVTNGFSDIVVAGGTQPGQRYGMTTIAGGTNGKLGQLTLDSVLVLEVNRETNAVRIMNPVGDAVNFDGYSILSPSGSLNPAAWTSLDDQNVSDWTEANGTATALNELKPTSSSAIANGAALNLGGAYQPAAPAEFGVDLSDLAFEYSLPSGEVIQGDISYVGNNYNNLVLTIDPTTGSAQLKNQSGFEIAVEAYQVSSGSGSLSPTGWSSLDDQGVASWAEANPSSNRVTELRAVGTETFASGTAFELGNLFTVGGTQDLELQFLLGGEDQLRTGVVHYGAIGTATLPGDYNRNGVVDAADYTVWKDNFGSNSALDADGNDNGVIDAADYTIWKDNFGNTLSVAAVASVPEPNTCGWLFAGLLGLVARLRRVRG